LREKQREKCSSPEAKKKMRDWQRAYRKTSEYQKNNKIYNRKPEVKEAKKLRARKRRKDPVINERIKERSRTPEIRHKKKIAMRIRRLDLRTRPMMLERDAKHASERRCLGYKPINELFENSCRHHLLTNSNGEPDNETFVYIPIKLHNSLSHNRDRKGKNMIEMNQMVLEWYIETYQKDKPYDEKVEYNISLLTGVIEGTKKRITEGWIDFRKSYII
jgi:hypothetical protein